MGILKIRPRRRRKLVLPVALKLYDCRCYDPVVFGHKLPCRFWESEGWEM